MTLKNVAMLSNCHFWTSKDYKGYHCAAERPELYWNGQDLPNKIAKFPQNHDAIFEFIVNYKNSTTILKINGKFIRSQKIDNIKYKLVIFLGNSKCTATILDFKVEDNDNNDNDEKEKQNLKVCIRTKPKYISFLYNYVQTKTPKWRWWKTKRNWRYWYNKISIMV